MREELRPGERIRVTVAVQDSAFRTGDRGIVLSGCRASEGGWFSYYVRMQGQAIGQWTLFAAEEIERDNEQAERIAASDDGPSTGRTAEGALASLFAFARPWGREAGSKSER